MPANKNIVKNLFLAALLLAALAMTGWLLTRQVLVSHARQKAERIIAEALENNPAATPDEKIIAIATTIFERFRHREPSEVPALRLRAWLTNERLPGFFRLPEGLIETEIEKGFCDNAARMLSFVLAQAGFPSVQWNMILPDGAHSALLVTLPDSRKILADAFYGYVTVDGEEKLISPIDAKNLLQSGVPFENIFRPLGKDSHPNFYRRFDKVVMAAQGDRLVMESDIPPLGGDAVTLGAIDGRSEDVRTGGSHYKMSPYWHYMGHQYSRDYIRILKAGEPVQIVMTLVAPAEDNIMIATPAPKVDGKTLSWTLKPGEQLVFTDGKARVSLRRLNSYIGIDQIAFLPVN